MDQADMQAINDKLRKLSWLECVHLTFIPANTPAGKALDAELRETQRLQKLCEKEAKQ